MRYIRILRPPRMINNQVQARITIESDLGESTLAIDHELMCFLQSTEGCKGAEVLASKKHKWKAGMRVLDVAMSTATELLRQTGGGMCLGIVPVHEDGSWDLVTHLPEGRRQLGQTREHLELVVGVRSANFAQTGNGELDDRMQKRVFLLANGSQLHIWENILPGIEGKIWDGGLTAVAHLNKLLASRLQAKTQPSDNRQTRPISILELGSGTGILGLFLAQTTPSSSITLTDLPSSCDLISRNLREITPASNTHVHFSVLEWGEKVPDEIHSQHFDVIVLADCTYNPDNASALVQTVTAIQQTSKDALIAFVSKQRHETEDVFHELMQDNDFNVVNRYCVPLPSEWVRVPLFEEKQEASEGGSVWFTFYVKSGALDDKRGKLKKPIWAEGHWLDVLWKEQANCLKWKEDST